MLKFWGLCSSKVYSYRKCAMKKRTLQQVRDEQIRMVSLDISLIMQNRSLVALDSAFTYDHIERKTVNKG